MLAFAATAQQTASFTDAEDTRATLARAQSQSRAAEERARRLEGGACSATRAVEKTAREFDAVSWR